MSRKARALSCGIAGIALFTTLSSAVAQRPVVSAVNGAMRGPQTITIDGRNGGRRFDGIGGVSAGASTRLLYDYPEPVRSRILDYLFKPGFGAGIQILKVEIGSDINSTDGSEPSHMRTREDLNFTRGYEWWLMKEARARNPAIVLAGLSWGAPGWLNGGFWSQDNVDYIIKWLDGAKTQGLKIDYVGGWNESGYEPRWFVLLAKALKKNHPDVGIIGADDLIEFNWRMASDMARDPEVHAAIDVIGQHSPGGWRSEYEKYESTAEARRSGKPLWASEESSLSHDVGGIPWARAINRAYVDAQITASINWAPVSAWYANLPIADTGLLLAEWPWSGYYEIGSSLWVYAHTTQFAQPGWQYIDSACGYLAGGGSYVTLKSPGGADYSVVIETVDEKTAEQVRFSIAGGLKTSVLHVWQSNLASDTGDDDFVQAADIHPENGVFTVTLEPGRVYSLSTTTGQSKGRFEVPSTVAAQLPLPFEESFEGLTAGKLARYFSDVNGGFETVSAGGGRPGMAYRQVVPMQPVSWHLAGGAGVAPTTVVGDPRWWGDYEVSSDVLLEQPGYVELIGRMSAQAARAFAGYHLRFGSDGQWKLYSQDIANVRETDVTIAEGPAAFAVGMWHTIALRMKGSNLGVLLDGHLLRTVADSDHRIGNIGLRVSGWQNAQFDNVKVLPTAPAPAFVPQSELAVSVSSEHTRIRRGDVFRASYLIDGRPESFWHSGFDPIVPLPASVTIDAGKMRKMTGLTYQPRIDNQTEGMITRYVISVSDDGSRFTRVAEGRWAVSTSTKVVTWAGRAARYVRLDAIEGVGNAATAAELNLVLAR